MKKSAFLIMMCLLNSSLLFPQVAVNNDGSAPDNSAMFDVQSTTKGFLLPRMTLEQIESISNPADGLQVYCTTDGKIYIFVLLSQLWKVINYGAETITPPFTCGYSITIDHVTGTVAPVTKTVTYSTVTNIPGEPSKCWITSNLGADHQATTVNDATEASAGWYWQFNRMQGYKHDGITRTPNTTWINSIDENFDWITANDPCTLLLGSGWRLPSNSEWNNVIASGGWTDWNGPWNSALKMHAAGFLDINNGSLLVRGSYGYYWSSSQFDNSSGLDLFFYSGYCFMSIDFKAYGFSARCLRD
jgi:uncharacterized protein (TIGR02145 family)